MKNKAFGILAVFILILIIAFGIGCAPTTTGYTLGGAGIGAAGGAALGAIIGVFTGNPAAGAAIGAAAGAAVGGTVGAATADDLKRRRAAGMVVPPAPPAVINYSPWYDGQFWRHPGMGNRTLWWNESREYWE